MSDSALHSAGFNDSDINRFRAFQRIHGRIKKYSDLVKIAGEFKANQFLQSRGFIKANSAEIKKKNYEKKWNFNATKKYKKKYSKNQPVNIQDGDSAALESLPCIGAKLALRIIKYRQLLGGFYDVSQIKDVHGIDTGCINKNIHLLFVKGEVIFLDENAYFMKTFYHPYLKGKNRTFFQNYVKNNSWPLRSEWLNLPVIDQETKVKMAPYFRINY